MSCQGIIDELSAWLDGALPGDAAAAVERHLAHCPRCRAVAEDLRAIVAVAPALGGDAMTTAADGWPRLERELRVQRRSGFRRWFPRLLAAAALLVATLGAVFALRGRSDDSAEARARFELMRLREQQERTLGALQAVVQRQRSEWDASLQRTFALNAALVDSALEDCRRALNTRPADLALRERMTEAYQRKVEFLTLFSGLAEPSDKTQQRGQP